MTNYIRRIKLIHIDPIQVVKDTKVEDVLYHTHSDPLAEHISVDELYQRIKI